MGAVKTMRLFRKREEKSAVDRVHVSQVQGNVRTGNLRDAYPYAPKTGSITTAQAAAIFSQSPMAFASASIVGGLLAGVPLNTYVLDRNSSGKKTIKRTGYPYVMLEWINPHMTKRQLVEYTAIWLHMVGDAYWVIEDTELRFKDISVFSIYPLNPLYTKIVIDPDTNRKGYVYDIGTDKQWYPDARVIHFKSFSPFDYWTGHSRMNPLSYDLQVEKYSKRQLRNFFAGGTIIDGILSSETDLDADEIRKLKREFKEQHEGTRNAHRVLVLTKGMKYEVPKPIAPDVSIAPLIEKTMDNNSMVFGVPVNVLLGKGEGLEESKALMWEQTIQPLGEIIESTLTKRLCMPLEGIQAGKRIVIGFDYSNVTALRLKDLDRARVEVAHVNTGIRTIDEVRGERNLDPINSEFTTKPKPEWEAEQKLKMQEEANRARMSMASGSPSLPLTGSEGGRDQSSSGEAELIDEGGTKAFMENFNIP